MLYFTFVSDFTETMEGNKFVCNSDFFILHLKHPEKKENDNYAVSEYGST